MHIATLRSCAACFCGAIPATLAYTNWLHLSHIRTHIHVRTLTHTHAYTNALCLSVPITLPLSYARSHLLDLIVTTEEVHYERYRDRKLLEGGLTDGMTPEQLRRELEAATKKKEKSIDQKLSDEVREQEKKFELRAAQLRQEEDTLKLERQKLAADVAALRTAVSDLNATLSPVPKKR
jgi:hypothetical protein